MKGSLWRTLFRVVSKDERHVQCILPGWNPRSPVTIPLEVFPEELQKQFVPDYRFFGKTNLRYEHENWIFKDFEWEGHSENSKFAMLMDKAFLT